MNDARGKQKRKKQREDVERRKRPLNVTVQHTIDWLLLRSQAWESQKYKRKPLHKLKGYAKVHIAIHVYKLYMYRQQRGQQLCGYNSTRTWLQHLGCVHLLVVYTSGNKQWRKGVPSNHQNIINSGGINTLVHGLHVSSQVTNLHMTSNLNQH